MKTLYLIRHGQASAGTSNYDRLSPLGLRQASLLGEHMLESGVPLPEEIWSGSLQRQQQTAEQFKKATGIPLQINTDQRLNEYDHRAVHNAYHPELAATRHSGAASEPVDLSPSMSFTTYERIIRNWMQDASANGHYGGETWQQFQQRTLSALLDIARSSQAATLALFTSGGVISVIANQLAQHPEDGIPDMIWNLNNGSVNTVHFKIDEAEIRELNNVEHFEKHQDESLLTKI